MKLLLIKTSSLGDILHTLPALTDTQRLRPDIRVDWVVEEGFAQIPTWSPLVESVIPIALRRWRKAPWKAMQSGEIPQFWQQLRTHRYEMILDAQGLLKSAVIARLGHGQCHGFDQNSAREPMATRLYHQSHAVPIQLHAVERLRLLFAQALGLPLPVGPPDFGLQAARFDWTTTPKSDLIFLHGTTWASKQWPESHWHALAKLAQQAKMAVLLPWGNVEEKARAERIQAAAPKACHLLPKLSLEQLAAHIATSTAAIATDSGPAHLAAALGTPTVGLYGPTDANRIGIVGQRLVRLAGPCPLAPCRKRVCPRPSVNSLDPPCLAALDPQQVFNTMETLA